MPHPEDNSAFLTAADEIRAYEYERGQVDKATELQPQIDAALELERRLEHATETLVELQLEYDEHMATHEPVPHLADDFTNLDGWLNPYHAAGAYDIQGVRLRDNVELEDGVLTVHTRPVTAATTVGGRTIPAGGWTAGGIMHREVLEPGTRLTLDLRMDESVGTRAVALLWPHQAPWPAGGELDFVEMGGDIPDRQSTAIANHWQGTDGHAQKVIKFGPHDFTDWTRVEVTWTNQFTVTIDGQEAAAFTDHLPPNPMKLAIQTAVAGGGHAPTFKGTARTPGCVQVRQLRLYRL